MRKPRRRAFESTSASAPKRAQAARRATARPKGPAFLAPHRRASIESMRARMGRKAQNHAAALSVRAAEDTGGTFPGADAQAGGILAEGTSEGVALGIRLAGERNLSPGRGRRSSAPALSPP